MGRFFLVYLAILLSFGAGIFFVLERGQLLPLFFAFTGLRTKIGS